MDVMQNLDPQIRESLEAMTAQFLESNFASKAAMFGELNAIAREGAIVFAGDSITEGFPVHELFPPSQPLYNRGIGGMSSGQMLEHLEDLVLGLSPKKAFVLIGTNDIHKGTGFDGTVENIRTIINRIEKECPATAIYLLSVLPVNNTKELYLYAVAERNNPDILRLNKYLKQLAEEMASTTFVDVHSRLADKQGNLRDDYTTDGLHLSVKGYREVAACIAPLID